ncbi:MAG: O-acetyl-ADP-ribose deacetylase [Verrucomicrobiota bacterium]
MKTVLDRIAIITGDIVTQKVDAIVNAANKSLLGGGGVDGAIHRAAGPGLLQECRSLNGCATGEAKITAGYHLPAKHIVHTVGPIWEDGTHGEDEALARCYQSCFALMKTHRLFTIAFPSISTGIYNFPLARACRIALTQTRIFLENNQEIHQVVFVCYGPGALRCYQEAAQEIFVAETPPTGSSSLQDGPATGENPASGH